MTQNGTPADDEMVSVGTLDFHVAFKKRDTHVTAIAETARGVVIAYGSARCRKDDHYDPNIGMDIATGRALKDLGETVELIGLERSVTEQQFQNSQIVASIELIVDRFSEAMGALARRFQQSR